MEALWVQTFGALRTHCDVRLQPSCGFVLKISTACESVSASKMSIRYVHFNMINLSGLNCTRISCFLTRKKILEMYSITDK